MVARRVPATVLVTLRTWGEAPSLNSCQGRSIRDETTVRSVLRVLWTPKINTHKQPHALYSQNITPSSPRAGEVRVLRGLGAGSSMLSRA